MVEETCPEPDWIADESCDAVNNIEACLYDGGDCCQGYGQDCFDCDNGDCTCHLNGTDYCQGKSLKHLVKHKNRLLAFQKFLALRMSSWLVTTLAILKPTLKLATGTTWIAAKVGIKPVPLAVTMWMSVNVIRLENLISATVKLVFVIET